MELGRTQLLPVEGRHGGSVRRQRILVDDQLASVTVTRGQATGRYKRPTRSAWRPADRKTCLLAAAGADARYGGGLYSHHAVQVALPAGRLRTSVSRCRCRRSEPAPPSTAGSRSLRSQRRAPAAATAEIQKSMRTTTSTTRWADKTDNRDAPRRAPAARSARCCLRFNDDDESPASSTPFACDTQRQSPPRVSFYRTTLHKNNTTATTEINRRSSVQIVSDEFI